MRVVLFLAVWLLRIDRWLTLLLFGMAPVAVIIALGFRRIARTVTQRARRVTAKINAQIQESISGIMVAKSFRQEPALYATFDANNRQAYQVGLRRGLTLNTIFPIMGISSGLGVALLFYLGGQATRSGAVSPGSWYLFMQAVGFFWWPLINIASFWSQFQDGLSSAERVFALIDAAPKVVQTAAEPVSQVAGQIEFRNVGFRYGGPESSSILSGINLRVAPGKMVAIGRMASGVVHEMSHPVGSLLLLAEALAERLERDAHAAPAEVFDDPVFADRLAGQVGEVVHAAAPGGARSRAGPQ